MTIAEIITNGILFDFKNWQNSMIEPGSIRRLLDLLSTRQISYLLVGGVAMLCGEKHHANKNRTQCLECQKTYAMQVIVLLGNVADRPLKALK